LKSYPKISIIIPAFNAEKYIAETIQSVLNQTFENWELIIINDGSKDSTEDIIKSFSDVRIILISQENQGVSAARNRGLDIAKGSNITFLDADDILPPKSLEVRVNYLNINSDIDLVDGIGLVKDLTLTKTLRIHNPYYHGDLLPRLVRLDSKVFSTNSYMFRKSILGDTKFQEDMTHSEDIFFYIELSSKQKINYSYVTEEIFWYRVGHVSAMNNLVGLEEGYLLLIKKVSRIKSISIAQNNYLRLRIARILFLTWLREKKIKKALQSLFHAISLSKVQ